MNSLVINISTSIHRELNCIFNDAALMNLPDNDSQRSSFQVNKTYC